MYKDYTQQREYKDGQIVFAKTNIKQPLIIRRYVDRVYYCKLKDNLLAKEQVYFARELQASPENQSK
ncbi:MAG: hypothetical protein RLO81_04525 [Fulvivirga sp.]|uniref:hypothetical protein n=1 Tax=Fulvivirga sp. TaxID=1931237 RepID=UPI0032ED19F2